MAESTENLVRQYEGQELAEIAAGLPVDVDGVVDVSDYLDALEARDGESDAGTIAELARGAEEDESHLQTAVDFMAQQGERSRRAAVSPAWSEREYGSITALAEALRGAGVDLPEIPESERMRIQREAAIRARGVLAQFGARPTPENLARLENVFWAAELSRHVELDEEDRAVLRPRTTTETLRSLHTLGYLDRGEFAALEKLREPELHLLLTADDDRLPPELRNVREVFVRAAQRTWRQPPTSPTPYLPAGASLAGFTGVDAPTRTLQVVRQVRANVERAVADRARLELLGLVGVGEIYLPYDPSLPMEEQIRPGDFEALSGVPLIQAYTRYVEVPGRPEATAREKAAYVIHLMEDNRRTSEAEARAERTWIETQFEDQVAKAFHFLFSKSGLLQLATEIKEATGGAAFIDRAQLELLLIQHGIDPDDRYAMRTLRDLGIDPTGPVTWRDVYRLDSNWRELRKKLRNWGPVGKMIAELVAVPKILLADFALDTAELDETTFLVGGTWGAARGVARVGKVPQVRAGLIDARFWRSQTALKDVVEGFRSLPQESRVRLAKRLRNALWDHAEAAERAAAEGRPLRGVRRVLDEADADVMFRTSAIADKAAEMFQRGLIDEGGGLIRRAAGRAEQWFRELPYEVLDPAGTLTMEALERGAGYTWQRSVLADAARARQAGALDDLLAGRPVRDVTWPAEWAETVPQIGARIREVQRLGERIGDVYDVHVLAEARKVRMMRRGQGVGEYSAEEVRVATEALKRLTHERDIWRGELKKGFIDRPFKPRKEFLSRTSPEFLVDMASAVDDFRSVLQGVDFRAGRALSAVEKRAAGRAERNVRRVDLAEARAQRQAAAAIRKHSDDWNRQTGAQEVAEASGRVRRARESRAALGVRQGALLGRREAEIGAVEQQIAALRAARAPGIGVLRETARSLRSDLRTMKKAVAGEIRDAEAAIRRAEREFKAVSRSAENVGVIRRLIEDWHRKREMATRSRTDIRARMLDEIEARMRIVNPRFQAELKTAIDRAFRIPKPVDEVRRVVRAMWEEQRAITELRGARAADIVSGLGSRLQQMGNVAKYVPFWGMRSALGRVMWHGLRRGHHWEWLQSSVERSFYKLQDRLPKLAETLEETLKKPGQRPDVLLRELDRIIQRDAPELASEAGRARAILSRAVEHNRLVVDKLYEYGLETETWAREIIETWYPHRMRAKEVLTGEAGRLGLRQAAAISRRHLRAQRPLEGVRLIWRRGRGEPRSKTFTSEDAARKWVEERYPSTWGNKKAMKKAGIEVLDPLDAVTRRVLGMDDSRILTYLTAMRRATETVAQYETIATLRASGLVLTTEKAARLAPELLTEGRHVHAEWIRMPDNLNFGPLRGTVVHREVLRALGRYGQYQSMIRSFVRGIEDELSAMGVKGLDMAMEVLDRHRPGWRNVVGLPRKALLLSWIGLNHMTWLGNPLFNVFSAMMAGIPPNALVSGKFWRGVRKWWQRDPEFVGLVDEGVNLNTTVAMADRIAYGQTFLERLERDLRGKPWQRAIKRIEEIDELLVRTERPLTGAERTHLMAEHRQLTALAGRSLGGGMARVMRHVIEGADDVRSTIQHAYGNVDLIMKAGYANWLLERAGKMGWDKGSVPWKIRTWFQNYAEIPPGIRQLTRNPMGTMIASFPYEWVRLFGNYIWHRPQVFGTFAVANGMNNIFNAAFFGISPEAWTARQGLNGDLRVAFATMFQKISLPVEVGGLPFKVDTGNYLGMSMLGSPMGVLRQWGLSLRQEPDPVSQVGALAVAGASHFVGNTPLLNLTMAAALNQDPYTGRPLTEDKSFHGRMKAFLRYFGRLVMPPLTPGGYYHELLSRAWDPRTGREIPGWERALRAFNVQRPTPREGLVNLARRAARLQYGAQVVTTSMFGRWADEDQALVDFYSAGSAHDGEEALSRLTEALDRPVRVIVGDQIEERRRPRLALARAFDRLSRKGHQSTFENLAVDLKAAALRMALESGEAQRDPEGFRDWVTMFIWGPHAILPETGTPRARLLTEALRRGYVPSRPTPFWKRLRDTEKMTSAVQQLGPPGDPLLDVLRNGLRKRLYELGVAVDPLGNVIGARR